MEKYILRRAINYNGETITEINMDLDGLSVEDLEKAEQTARSLIGKKQNIFMIELNRKYQACVASVASKLPLEAIRSLSGKDYTQVCMLVADFLVDGDWEETESLTGGNQNKFGETQTLKTSKIPEKNSNQDTAQG